MSEIDMDTFVRRYQAARASEDSSALARLWHSDGTLHHPTLTEPISGDKVPAFDTFARANSGLRWQLDGWAARDNVLFLEWTCTATIGGAELTWSGVDRMVLKEGRIAEEVVYHDTLPLWAAIDPARQRAALIDAGRFSADPTPA